MFTTLRRLGDAIITAIGVVVGLTPDPTRQPVLIPVKHERTHDR
jgi:hypothetical protein